MKNEPTLFDDIPNRDESSRSGALLTEIEVAAIRRACLPTDPKGDLLSTGEIEQVHEWARSTKSASFILVLLFRGDASVTSVKDGAPILSFTDAGEHLMKEYCRPRVCTTPRSPNAPEELGEEL